MSELDKPDAADGSEDKEVSNARQTNGRSGRRHHERVGLTVSTWTAILAAVMTVVALVIGLYGFTTIQDMRDIQREVAQIRAIRQEMEQTQAEMELIQEDIGLALSSSANDLAEMRRIANWILEEQRGAIDSMNEELSISLRVAERRFEELDAQIEDSRSALRHLDNVADEVRADAEEIHESLRQSQEEADSLNN